MAYEIVTLRDRMGLTTAQLARLVGVTRQAADNWMNGRAVPEPTMRLLRLIRWYADNKDADGYAITELREVMGEKYESR
jgi:DNA-binding transcriptional regulator YiaG